jgi:hypothetical protein
MGVARRGRFTDLLDRYNMHDLLRRLKRDHLLVPSTMGGQECGGELSPGSGLS